MFYMNINIPKNVKFIIDTYYNNNYEAFMVGGCLRDWLLGLTPKDYDITTSALPNITESLFYVIVLCHLFSLLLYIPSQSVL